MTYQPNPIDTGAIVLGPQIEELVEHLAESIHDNWALRRMAEGWSYGPNRDDTKKIHPDLVSYGISRNQRRSTIERQFARRSRASWRLASRSGRRTCNRIGKAGLLARHVRTVSFRKAASAS